MARLVETTGASITIKGVYYEKGKEPGFDDPPKLHLLIESNDDMRIKTAIGEIKQILLDASTSALQQADDPSRPGGRYNVL
jgi:ATP-dependent RNA helicase DDX46/PRP5